eukprot:CAMPEP_0201099720 /NCGR_PEP_ID=MMETSP0812-20130820/8665_1 /ASSEMBLY_ACC=CAM_ASM_000668 /TAXON_ID=98059 /ORGANISM="Dinobryon sp., Strain UTEXLB2267" /LENGTH=563 /DNA_ID=CAMNT_0047355739 /DNA_START=52 /DNA_END=1739 /DNA_ORIENTATION=+
MSQEQWYMIFSILSATTSACLGRPPVWRTVAYLVENDLINDMNFTPCRHLLLRFFQGVFPGEEPSSDGDSLTVEACGDGSSHWGPRAMSYLARLAMMALAGYFTKKAAESGPHAFTHWKRSDGTSEPLNKPQRHNEDGMAGRYSPLKPSSVMSVHRLVRFYLPSEKKYGSSRTVSACGDEVLWKGISIDCTVISGVHQLAEQDSSHGSHPPHVSIPPVSVAGNEEVEMLWFETVKLFSEFRPPNTAKAENGLRLQLRALYTLEAVFLAGRTAKLPTSIWLRGLGETMLRLPMGLSMTTLQQPPAGPVGTIPELALALSLQACVLVLDLLVADIADLRRCSEFAATYSRFMALLAANAHCCWAALHPGSGAVGTSGGLSGLRPQLGAYSDEMALLIEAALRLLHIPASEAVSVAEAASAVSTVTTAGAAKGSYFGGIFGWVAGGATPVTVSGAAGLNPPPPPLPATNPLNASQQQTPQLTTSSEQSDWVSVTSSTTASDQSGVSGDANMDGELLCLAWRTVLGVFPQFAASLRSKNPRLLADVTRFVELWPLRDADHQNLVVSG